MTYAKVDIVPSRLEFARAYAATHVFQPPSPEAEESKIDYSKRSAGEAKKSLGIEERGPNAIDLIIDASGAEVSIQTAIYLAKAGGTFVQVDCFFQELDAIHRPVLGRDG
jgi:D-xylulose reductase